MLNVSQRNGVEILWCDGGTSADDFTLNKVTYLILVVMPERNWFASEPVNKSHTLMFY